MFMGVAPEAEQFLIAVCFGGILGVGWDLFRILRLAGFASRALVFAEDLLYMLLVTLVTLLFFYWFTSGDFRVYVLIGEFLGWVLYYCTLGRLVYSVSRVIIAWIRRLLGWIFWPFRFLFRHVYQWMRHVFGKIRSFFKKIWKKVKKSLRFSIGLLYNSFIAQKTQTTTGQEKKRRKQACRRKPSGKRDPFSLN